MWLSLWLASLAPALRAQVLQFGVPFGRRESPVRSRLSGRIRHTPSSAALFARQVWGLSHLQWFFVSDYPDDSCAWLERVTQRLTGDDLDLFMTICLAIWWNRNRTLMDSITLPPDELVLFASNYLFTFRQVHMSVARTSVGVAPARWSPPNDTVIKLNYDGAIFAESGEIGVGVVARDCTGACVGWTTMKQAKQATPELVEALAARAAISFALSSGWRKITLEGDCSNLYYKLSSPLADCSVVGTVVRDIKQLGLSFSSCTFSLVRRAGNTIAHLLARNANNSNSGTSVCPPRLFFPLVT
ncbi:hypothetical protein Salat_1437200 [Sesamum alatum]|uniref:RNase H type-1 domain-containing protein n=1 Tax=Sesamum alatum TaxID=300844 RepID=A0AAE1YAI1_9LAMI|nr:hypothetical protein Salat_1437200 [Sesamum alatum]